MIPATERSPCLELAERLDRLRVSFSNSQRDPKRLRADLEGLQGLPPPQGLDQESDPVDRLLRMTEVWECLAGNDPGAADILTGFFAEAIDRLAEGARLGNLETATRWVLRVSGEGWGDYLTLLDPTMEGEGLPTLEADQPTSDPEIEVAPTIDLVGQFRSITAGIAETSALDAALVSSEPGPTHKGEQDSKGRVPNPIAEARVIEIDEELRDIYVADATDLLVRLQDLILGLGEDDGDAERLQEIGRCLHTLKGASGSVGLSGLASRIHGLEDEINNRKGQTPTALIPSLEDLLTLIEAVLEALTDHRKKGRQDYRPNEPTTQEALGNASSSTRPSDSVADLIASDTDGLIRIPASRIEELTDLCSELLTRRRAWTEQADRMKQLAITARSCGHRLRTSVDRLAESAAETRTGIVPRPTLQGEEPDVLIRRLSEQAEDLAALAVTAREAALPIANEAEDLSRLSLRIWEMLQSVRIIPVRGLFQRLVRVAREAARVEGRSIEVEFIGEETGADRTLLDKLYEPALHIVRNAVGHGIEDSETRVRAGKPPTGRITLEARRECNTLVLSVRDDGRGLDYERIEAKGRRLGLLDEDRPPSIDRLNALVFQSGFSTRTEVNAISGRGVGLDVVAAEVEALRGRIELTSEQGRGTRMEIRLPSRHSLEHVMIVRVGDQSIAIPTASIESVQPTPAPPSDHPCSGVHTIEIGGKTRPVIDLGLLLGIPGSNRERGPRLLSVISDSESIALRVDRILGPLELVLRPLGPLLSGHPVISGAGLTTGGEVVPALDMSGLFRLAKLGQTTPIAPLLPGEAEAEGRPTALIVDDSLSVRRVVRRHLQELGFEVDEASDGEQALDRLRGRSYHLILTDLEMPRMDGFALLAELGRTGVLEQSVVIVTSTLTDSITESRARTLGAHAFVAKPVSAGELALRASSLLQREHRPPRIPTSP